MQLSVIQRLLLLNLIPTEGDITTVRIVQSLRSDLSFSEEEHAQMSMSVSDGQVTWNREAEAPKNIEIGPKGHAMICEALRKKSEQKKLTVEMIELYDLFKVDDVK